MRRVTSQSRTEHSVRDKGIDIWFRIFKDIPMLVSSGCQEDFRGRQSSISRPISHMFSQALSHDIHVSRGEQSERIRHIKWYFVILAGI